jgi:hypothetical protein
MAAEKVTVVVSEAQRERLLSRVVCHERGRSTRLRATVREMEVGPPGSAIRSLIPSHRELLRSRAVVVSVTEMSGRRSRQARSREANASEPLMKCRKEIR